MSSESFSDVESVSKPTSSREYADHWLADESPTWRGIWASNADRAMAHFKKSRVPVIHGVRTDGDKLIPYASSGGLQLWPKDAENYKPAHGGEKLHLTRGLQNTVAE